MLRPYADADPRRQDTFLFEIYQLTVPDSRGLIEYAYRVVERDSGRIGRIIFDSLNGSERRLYFRKLLERELIITDVVKEVIPARSDANYSSRVSGLDADQQAFCYQHGDAIHAEVDRRYGM